MQVLSISVRVHCTRTTIYLKICLRFSSSMRRKPISLLSRKLWAVHAPVSPFPTASLNTDILFPPPGLFDLGYLRISTEKQNQKLQTGLEKNYIFFWLLFTLALICKSEVGGEPSGITGRRLITTAVCCLSSNATHRRINSKCNLCNRIDDGVGCVAETPTTSKFLLTLR